ncbi:hypothetical protein M0R45_008062 [Rubus argutus]|uniref:Uncharacterized protein n=1 Tax=Rubus argutus TaxID=59490 RepID=A0AAW1Y0Y5_RUBAR
MGMKGVRKLSRRIFKNFCKRDRDLWRSYEDACKNDENFLTELCKFLESIEKCLIQVKDMEKNGGGSDGYMTILEKLKNVDDQNSADMLKKVECLITQRNDLQGELTSELKQLIGENEKPRKKTAWRRCLRMATYMLFIGAVAAEFACTVMAAVMVAPLVALAIAAAIIPTLAGQYWTLSCIEESKVSFRCPDNVIRSMQAGTVVAIKELGEIGTYLCRVVKDIKSLLSHLNSGTEGEVDLNMNLIERLLKNSKDLKDKATNCKSKILKARDEVSMSINKVTKSR